MVDKLSTELAGQKRKEPSDVPAKTLDPRKRPRTMSPEDTLRMKIVEQERHISELEGRLSQVMEASKTRRVSDEWELTNMRSCLKDLLDKADENQGLIRKLESDVELKEEALQKASAALVVKKEDISAAARTISSLKNRVEYLYNDREYVRSDVRRYRSNARDIYIHYKSKEKRRAEREQSYPSSCGSDCSDDTVIERASHAPESRSRDDNRTSSK
ncbi:hypothetical protein DFH07DRAFT_259379 [Mycena maculata]|uniref:Uncharacterized protein n=1 Tax=Mycena maculata TaxID=230809 RepID=A0AAD7JV18_9AGAR|nr:hypothetical protein DFH07DRAFT_259379 [Mycena maculata]